jgi:cysteine-rich repeat protein
VFINNQFGQSTMQTFRTRELCVPSFVNPGSCGDGSVNAPGEQCDPPHDSACSGVCNVDCTCPVCGNGLTEGGEQCDDGNAIEGDACDSNCTLPGCGNNIVDPGEDCDDGNLIDGDTCESDCTLPSCGNGIVDGSETCDDGVNNGLSGFCNATCDGTVP